ncbi:GGDEF domain-containing protein [Ornithinibacillus californiensis]|uniref:GGDEF domain-containing protein n=1 Tax=Ornithinibacillus californiensis TaxID=161536 RepID=UPI00064DD9B2|nr:GGDEF domain-containing protein [Ornithinibacillus californiensis]
MQVVIGDIVSEAISVVPSTKCEEVYSIFENNPSLEGIIVGVDDNPVGIVMRTNFFQKLSTKYGFDLFMNRSIDLVMSQELLTVERSLPLTEASTLAMNRKQENLYDYVIVTAKGKLQGVVSIRELVNKLSEVQINIAKYSNPLSGLPGNHIIDETLHEILTYEAYTVFYIDLDSFKEFNDTFGFIEGDEVIKETATIIKNVIMKEADNRSFVGHIGGDDFIAAVPHFEHENLCHLIISQFEKAVMRFYSEEDVKRGYVKVINRKGNFVNIPLLSISIAVIQNKDCTIETVEELSMKAAEVKSCCKSKKQSVYLTLDEVEKNTSDC